MQLTEHIYLVGAGDVGLAITDSLDCNVYLIDTGAGAILIDAGAGNDPKPMEKVITSHGFNMADIKILVLTHYHADHSCGAARIKKLSGCRVYAPEKEVSAIISGDLEQIGMAPAMRAGFTYPKGYTFQPCEGVEPLEDGSIVELGNVSLKIFCIPGHSLQDAVLYGEVDGKNVMISGDVFFPRGQILLQNLPDVCIYDYSKALGNLADKKIDILLPGHREPCLNRAGQHLKMVMDKFNSLLIPPQLV